jgi:hypothetical protein
MNHGGLCIVPGGNHMQKLLNTAATIAFLLHLLTSQAAATSVHPLLLIIENGDGSSLISIPIEPGESFTIRYIHSVDISPVHEVFYADEKKGIMIKETYFKMFGAGMGHWPGRGTIVEENGWIFIKDMDIAIGEFYLRVGTPAVDHTILIKGQEIRLSRMLPGSRVRLYIKQVEK